MSETIIYWVIDLLAANPHMAVLITIMSVARAIFKPLCSLIQKYVDSTPSEADNKWWLEVQNHKVFQAVAYFVDFFLSIKLPKK